MKTKKNFYRIQIKKKMLKPNDQYKLKNQLDLKEFWNLKEVRKK